MTDPWRKLLCRMALVTVVTSVAAAAFIAAVDPYDAGRIPGLGLGYTRAQAPRTAHASRARDPAFDAVIIGNSHVQLINPLRLGQATGAHFVSLAVPGSGVPEHQALLNYFLRRRPQPPKAVVIGVDEYTCRAGTITREQLQGGPFPFWLYASDFWTFAKGSFRAHVFEDAVAFALGVGGANVLAGRDGYWNYELGRTWREPEAAVAARTMSLADRPGPFRGVGVLREMLEEIPPLTPVILLLTPVYAPWRPRPESPAALAELACKVAVAEIAGRTNARLLDFRSDTPLTRDPKSFWDGSHITETAALRIEAAITEAIQASKN